MSEVGHRKGVMVSEDRYDTVARIQADTRENHAVVNAAAVRAGVVRADGLAGRTSEPPYWPVGTPCSPVETPCLLAGHTILAVCTSLMVPDMRTLRPVLAVRMVLHTADPHGRAQRTPGFPER